MAASAQVRRLLIPGARPPYSYRWVDADKTRLEPEPQTALVLRRIFEDYVVSHLSLRELAHALTCEQVPTPSGKASEWHMTTLRTLLTNPIYAGQAQALTWRTLYHAPDRRDQFKSRTYKVRRGQDEIVTLPEGVAPPLVSATLWDEAQRRLATNRARSRRRAADPDSALLRGGLARCALCGYPMMTDHRGGPPQVPRYRCRHGLRTRGMGCRAHTILVPALDAAVWGKVSEVLSHPALIDQEVARMREMPNPGADTLSVFDQQLADLVRRMAHKRTFVELVSDPDEQRELAHELDLLATQRRRTEAERQRAAEHYGAWRRQQEDLERAIDWAGRVAGNLASLTPAERRHFLDALHADVRVWPHDVPGPDGARAVLNPASARLRRCGAPPRCLGATSSPVTLRVFRTVCLSSRQLAMGWGVWGAAAALSH